MTHLTFSLGGNGIVMAASHNRKGAVTRQSHEPNVDMPR